MMLLYSWNSPKHVRFSCCCTRYQILSTSQISNITTTKLNLCFIIPPSIHDKLILALPFYTKVKKVCWQKYLYKNIYNGSNSILYNWTVKVTNKTTWYKDYLTCGLSGYFPTREFIPLPFCLFVCCCFFCFFVDGFWLLFSIYYSSCLVFKSYSITYFSR